MPHRSIPLHQRQNARKLRRTMTDVERKLWNALRDKRFAGIGFRRQEPIGTYIADFVCHAARLIIEVDGSQHAEIEHLARDHIRDAFLAEARYRIIRFWNFEINANFDAVLDQIYISLIEQGLPLEACVITASPMSTSPVSTP